MPLCHRDFQGYGVNPPHPDWPNQARVAIAIVVNIQTGAERSRAMGDRANEPSHEVIADATDVPDYCLESHFEFGTRVGFWRIFRLFEQYGVKVTTNVCARALELSPWLATEIVQRGHEVCAHGYRWETPARLSEAEEREAIAKTVRIITETAGVQPVGWQSRPPRSAHTRRLLLERGGFLYNADAYNDELPYFVTVNEQPLLILPYSFDTNDIRFTTPAAFRLADDFATYLLNSFSWLWREGATHPRLMTVGLHLRISGRPGRIDALQQFLERVTNCPGVWIARRDEIARHWLQQFPPS